MKQVIVFILLLLISGTCFADKDYVDVSKLTDTQKAAIALETAKIADQNKNPTAVVDQVDKWVTIGTNLGKGLAGTAKELGIEVNKFAETPVGKVTAGLIIWKMAGRDLVSLGMHVIGGPVFFTVMMIFWIWFFRKMCMIVEVTEKTVTDKDGKPTKTKSTVSRLNTNQDGYIFVTIVGLVAIVGISIMITFSY